MQVNKLTLTTLETDIAEGLRHARLYRGWQPSGDLVHRFENLERLKVWKLSYGRLQTAR